MTRAICRNEFRDHGEPRDLKDSLDVVAPADRGVHSVHQDCAADSRQEPENEPERELLDAAGRDGVDRDEARRACQVPVPFEPAVVLAIGYAGDPETLRIDKHRVAERTPRQRRSIEEFVFEGVWGRAFE